MASGDYVLGIDYGAKRIGLAIAHRVARLPRPLQTLEATSSVLQQIEAIIEREQIGLVVVGLPRSMDGSIHAQAARVEQFITLLSDVISVPVRQVDETLTSVQAEEILASEGKRVVLGKGQIDAMAAALILERYFEEDQGLGEYIAP